MAMTSKQNDLSKVMTKDPVSMPSTTPVAEAARIMKTRDVGDVIVLDGNKITGVVTDRDIVVRAIAENRDPQQTKLADICSKNVITLERTATVDEAIQTMRDHAVRRLPVTEAGKPVGIVSLGDLAVMRDPNSALADISGAPANS